MEEEIKQEEGLEIEESVNTQHKPHPHAFRRLLIGLGAITCIVLGGILWSGWGDKIKEACSGDDEICSVELPQTPSAN